MEIRCRDAEPTTRNWSTAHRPDGGSCALCLHNVSDRSVAAPIRLADLDLHPDKWRDLLTGKMYPVEGDELHLPLPAYAVRWLSPSVLSQ